jgi:glycosyltransferase involved in cell wall biosynthesis
VVDDLEHPSGGHCHTVCELTDALLELGLQRVVVTTCGHRHKPEVLPRHSRATVYRTRGARLEFLRVTLAPGFTSNLEAVCRMAEANIMHVHGVWTPPTHAAGVVARRLGIPQVISTHGFLCEWALAYKRWKKRLAWHLYQARDLRRAAALHATAAPEATDLRRLGLRNPIAIVPNGVTLPPPGGRSVNATRGRSVLFLSRVHPKKGLLNLVQAWSRLRPAGWRVVVAGPDEDGHQRVVQEAVCAEGLEAAFTFVGEKQGAEKWALFRESDLFVLPSFNENFGLVIAEALACGVPVITTRATPWKELVTHECGWWVELGPEPLAAALREALSASDDARREMGARGQKLVSENYSWRRCAERIEAVYLWLLGCGARPDYVRLD